MTDEIDSLDDLEPQLPPATLEEMKGLTEKLFVLRREKDAAKKVSDEIQERYSKIEGEVLRGLEAVGLDSFKVPGVGSVNIKEYASVKIPQTLDKKKELFAYLEARGIFHELVTVNSATLNSFYSEERALAEAKGDFDFKLPGLEPPHLYNKLSIRKG